MGIIVPHRPVTLIDAKFYAGWGSLWLFNYEDRIPCEQWSEPEPYPWWMSGEDLKEINLSCQPISDIFAINISQIKGPFNTLEEAENYILSHPPAG